MASKISVDWIPALSAGPPGITEITDAVAEALRYRSAGTSPLASFLCALYSLYWAAGQVAGVGIERFQSRPCRAPSVTAGIFGSSTVFAAHTRQHFAVHRHLAISTVIIRCADSVQPPTMVKISTAAEGMRITALILLAFQKSSHNRQYFPVEVSIPLSFLDAGFPFV